MSAEPAANTWGALLAEAFAKAPDPDERLPISNRPATVYGSTLPFLVHSACWCDWDFLLTGLVGCELDCGLVSTVGAGQDCARTRLG